MAPKNKGVPWRKFKHHQGSAKQRGIPFLLTFEDWCGIWFASGHWEERGRRRGQYVMARFMDRGAYERGNVRICSVGENTEEMRSALPPRTKRSHEQYKAQNREYRRRQRADYVRVDPARAAATFNRRMVVRDGRRRWAHPGDVDYPG